jgi:hypothetical protein
VWKSSKHKLARTIFICCGVSLRNTVKHKLWGISKGKAA